MTPSTAAETRYLNYRLNGPSVDDSLCEEFLDQCFSWIVQCRAYQLWEKECRDTGRLVHGHDKEHWFLALAEVEGHLPNGPVDQHVLRYVRELALKELAYTKWLNRTREGSYASAGSDKSDWVAAERELNEIASLTDEHLISVDLPNILRMAAPTADLSCRKTALHLVRLVADVTDAPHVKDDGEPHIMKFPLGHDESVGDGRKSPLDGLSDSERVKLEGLLLAVDRTGNILESAKTKEELLAKMEGQGGNWHIHPGIPIGGKLQLPTVHATDR